MRHFYNLSDVHDDAINEILALSNRLRFYPEPQALQGKVLALLFLSPSLRTLSSLQAAMTRMGGGTFLVSPDRTSHGLESEEGVVMDGRAAEHIRDALPVIDSYGDAVGIRAFATRRNLENDLADKTYKSMASLIRKPLINLESAIQHPCQSLADWKTLDDLGLPKERCKIVITWAYHPRPLPLAGPLAAIEMAAMRGMDISVLRPEGFSLPATIVSDVSAIASQRGGSLVETSDRRQAMEGAQVVYVREWSSTSVYGDRPQEEKLRADLADWCVDEPWFANTKKDCRVMHAMPVRRGVAISDKVLDGPRSVLTQQAANRMWTQMGLLHHMLRSGPPL